jgi:hypothetical protein
VLCPVSLKLSLPVTVFTLWMKDSGNFRMILVSSLRYLTALALIFTTCILVLHRVCSDVPFVEIDAKGGERSDDSKESLLILLHIYATYATFVFNATWLLCRLKLCLHCCV